MQRVTGIGGIFIKSNDPKALAAWYKKHLGLNMEDWGGVMFPWKELPQANPKAFSLLSFFKQETDYLQPSGREFMLNLVVNDLDVLLEELKKEGIECVGEPKVDEFGKFAWIMDPEGTKLELWQPPANE